MSTPTSAETHFDPKIVDRKWQDRWQQANLFTAQAEGAQKKYYVLEMFPYPSGRLHMGHVRNYTIGDVIARIRKKRGYNVLHPMGWDAFGLPAENAAIAAGVHPEKWTEQNIAQMKEQMVRLGWSYDWTREFATCDPEYFVHEQRIFVEMYRRGLAYRKAALVNWCPTCLTVLANEQVEDGHCWRCRSVVEQRNLQQWFLKVTAYADELLRDLEKIRGGWPDKVLAMQEYWIGRSEGAQIRFALEQPVSTEENTIEVFTTRPDTLYGVTFISIAAEHPLTEKLIARHANPAELSQFVSRIRAQDKITRSSVDTVKEGVFTGAYCTHPLTAERIPIYVANFVLMDYGTGAVMAVPAHDERDFAFAQKYQLPVKIVIQPASETLVADDLKAAYTDAGQLVDSGPFTGLDNEAAKAQITRLLEERQAGRAAITFRIRDWLVSRQRFWGAPIPMVVCPKHGYQPVPEAELPVRLPAEVSQAEGGKSPLYSHPTWRKTECPVCGGPAERETDTMDGFMDSSWYMLRYAAANAASGEWLDQVALARWLPVDQYIGGAEHATKHLIYARFFTKMLRDWGWLPADIDEPFARLLTQGMVCKETYRCEEHGYLYPEEITAQNKCSRCGRDVMVGRIEKMSKSLKNVVEPLGLVEKFGADTVRVFSLFAAPPESVLEWNDAGVEGAWRFLNRVFRLVNQVAEKPRTGSPDSELRQKTHATIQKVTEDVGGERFHFNTAISAIMELVNRIYAEPSLAEISSPAVVEAVEAVLHLLCPFAPHLCEELWQKLGHQSLLSATDWPDFDPKLVARRIISFPVQVNGKLRGQVEAEPEATQAVVETSARAIKAVEVALAEKTVKKVIFVPGRLINFVVQ